MPGISSHQLLDVVHDHFHRATGLQSQVIAQRDVHERPLAPEIAAYVGGVELYAGLGQAPNGGELTSQNEGVLVVNPDLYPVIAINLHHAGMRLDVDLMRQLEGKCVFEDQIGLQKPLVYVPFSPDVVRQDVIDVGGWLG